MKETTHLKRGSDGSRIDAMRLQFQCLPSEGLCCPRPSVTNNAIEVFRFSLEDTPQAVMLAATSSHEARLEGDGSGGTAAAVVCGIPQGPNLSPPASLTPSQRLDPPAGPKRG